MSWTRDRVYRCLLWVWLAVEERRNERSRYYIYKLDLNTHKHAHLGNHKLQDARKQNPTENNAKEKSAHGHHQQFQAMHLHLSNRILESQLRNLYLKNYLIFASNCGAMLFPHCWKLIWIESSDIWQSSEVDFERLTCEFRSQRIWQNVAINWLPLIPSHSIIFICHSVAAKQLENKIRFV